MFQQAMLVSANRMTAARIKCFNDIPSSSAILRPLFTSRAAATVVPVIYRLYRRILDEQSHLSSKVGASFLAFVTHDSLALFPGSRAAAMDPWCEYFSQPHNAQYILESFRESIAPRMDSISQPGQGKGMDFYLKTSLFAF